MTVSADDLARWAEEHRRFALPDGSEWCAEDDIEWPCLTARLLALVAAQADQIARHDDMRLANYAKAETDKARERAKQAEAKIAGLRAALADFADHGLRADLMPTTPGGPESIPHLYRYLARLDQSVRERARAALDGTEATP